MININEYYADYAERLDQFNKAIYEWMGYQLTKGPDKIKYMDNENNTSYLFEWRCDCCLDPACKDSPRVCTIVSRDRPGCGRSYLYHHFTRSLMPVELPQRDKFVKVKE